MRDFILSYILVNIRSRQNSNLHKESRHTLRAYYLDEYFRECVAFSCEEERI